MPPTVTIMPPHGHYQPQVFEVVQVIKHGPPQQGASASGPNMGPPANGVPQQRAPQPHMAPAMNPHANMFVPRGGGFSQMLPTSQVKNLDQVVETRVWCEVG